MISFGALRVRSSGCSPDDGLGEAVVLECAGDGDRDFVALERSNGISWFTSLRTTIVNLFCLDAGICSINLIDWVFFVIKGPPACSVPGGCPWMKKYNYI